MCPLPSVAGTPSDFAATASHLDLGSRSLLSCVEVGALRSGCKPSRWTCLEERGESGPVSNTKALCMNQEAHGKWSSS